MKKIISHLIGHIVYIISYCILIVLSILLYNSANLLALLYVGWTTLGLGIIILFSSSQSRRKGRVTETGISKETLVESGLYGFVRHPEFLGHMLVIFSLVIIGQHLVNLVIGTLLIFLLCFAMVQEEVKNIEKFGNAYKDYMQRVPRINLLTGIIRQMYSKKGNKEER